MTVRFPADFYWGAGTSAYQIEGATAEGGRGTSIWDRFVRVPGAIRGGDKGDVAADHFHRFEHDIALMKSLGLNAYRFSTAWPRVFADGRGSVNREGLAFYDRLVDLLLTHGIEPFPTLYHWDLPQALHEQGGWQERSTIEAFGSYAEVMVGTLGDRVKHWSTVCEPWTISFLGYSSGVHAPGQKDPAAAFVVAHHLLLAHAAAARVIAGSTRSTMLNLNLYPVYPATDRDEDVALATMIDGLQNRLFLDPLLHGRYPSDIEETIDRIAGLGHVRDDDLSEISNTTDALGVNYYSIFHVASAADSPEPAMFPGAGGLRFLEPKPKTAMGWQIHPDGLYEILVRLEADYPPIPIYVTENGAAFTDVFEDGKVHDPDRVAYIKSHVEACRRAIAAGVDLRSYFVWSLMDNFEWTEGYSKRFGIIWVDYENQTRVPKDSAHWYRDHIEHEVAVSAR